MEQKIEFTPKEDEQIRVFKDTYNALYLEGFSESKLNYIKSTSNPVYCKLIDNLKPKVKSYSQHQYIEGPISINKFKMEAEGRPKKSFYIFGEVHTDTRGHCDIINGNASFFGDITQIQDAFMCNQVVLTCVQNWKILI